MSGESSATFVDALEALSRVLADLDTPSMIIGGVAVIASGVPRSTVIGLQLAHPEDVRHADIEFRNLKIRPLAK